MNFNWDEWDFENTNDDATKLAFICEDQNLTWFEFQQQTLALKSLLVEKEIVGPIVIYGHKEALFPIAITACLMANVTYIPIDVLLPENRIKKIKEISGATTLINCTKNSLQSIFKNEITSTNKTSVGENNSTRTKTNSTNRLAYIIFTSGSSGDPKGVMISRTALQSFAKSLSLNFKSATPETYFNQALFSFDISLFEFCLTLSKGETCVLTSSAVATSPESFISLLEQSKCTFWNSTPSFVYLCLHQPKFNAENLPHLNKFMLMGESFGKSLVAKLNNSFPSATIYNGYGPTEATVIASFMKVTRENTTSNAPISAYPSETIILPDLTDSNPFSEILIASDQVGEGYLNDEEKTKQTFTTMNNKKVFRTGDVGFVEGNYIYFHNRKDDQIKYNGYRIEPMEIDLTLMKHQSMDFCVTIPLLKENKVLRLLTFIPKAQNPSIQNEDLFEVFRSFLAQELPAYMAKPELILVDNLPYTSSFKVDKTLLVESYLAG